MELSKTLTIMVFALAFITNLGMAQPIVEVKAETIQGFNQYLESFLLDFEKPPAVNQPFLFNDHENPVLRERLKTGEVVITQNQNLPDIPNGIIHHWKGAVYFARADLEEVVALLTDYSRHTEIYPEVIESRLIEKRGNQVKGYLRLKKKQFFLVVLDTEYETQIKSLDERRQTISSHSTRITEIRDFEKPEQQELAIGKDSGFVWRLNTYWRIEQGESGVFAECDSISLSRDIPSVIAWMIRPIINGAPRQTLAGLLSDTQKALTKQQNVK